MTLGERIKKVRRELDLTQQKFADRIGTTQNAVGNYETGHRNPSSSVINNICKTFNISETWLRTGDGEMFQQVGSDEELKRIFEDLSVSEDETLKRVIRAYWRLSDNGKAGFRELLDNLVAEYVRGSGKEPARTTTEQAEENTAGQERAVPDLAAKVAELERQNQELAAEIAAMKEEDAIEAERLRSASAGSFSQPENAKNKPGKV